MDSASKDIYRESGDMNVIKMENSLLAIFDEIWLKTMYYSTGYFDKFLSNFKNS